MTEQETKVCAGCGGEIRRASNCSAEGWARKKFCSVACRYPARPEAPPRAPSRAERAEEAKEERLAEIAEQIATGELVIRHVADLSPDERERYLVRRPPVERYVPEARQ